MANYDFLFLKRKRETSSGQVQTDYAHRIKPDTESFLWLPAGKRDLVSNRHY